MSLDPILWALKDSPVADAQERLILVCLAERANRDDGCGCWPSQGTLARAALISERTVRDRLVSLEARGLIARGDQSLVGHFPADRQPVVWDVMVPLSQMRNLERVNTERAESRLPPLTSADRPDLGPAPERSARADKGVRRSDRRTTPPGVEVPPAYNSATGGVVVHDGGRSTPTNNPLNHPSEPPPTPVVEQARTKKRGTRVPDDFPLTEGMKAWAEKNLRGVSIVAETEQWRDHHLAKDDRMSDWTASWRTWMRNAEKWGASGRRVVANRYNGDTSGIEHDERWAAYG